MKRAIGLLLGCLLWTASAASAQVIPPNQTITVIDSGTACVTAPAACAIWAPTVANVVAIDISGTWTGTLTFEATANGGVWNSVIATLASTGAVSSTTTTNGTFSIPNAGYQGIRVRATSAVTGTASLTASRGYLNAKILVPLFPVSGSAVGDLLTVSATSPLTLTGIADTATGQVLVSKGVGVAPGYSATPTVTSLTASGGITTMAGSNITSAGGLIAAGSQFVVSGSTAKVQTYANMTTAGEGVALVVGYGDVVAATNTATASIATFTPGSDATLEVGCNINVTTSNTHSFSCNVTYTDETNTSRVMILPVNQLAGTFITLITNITGVGPYESPVMTIRVKASTAVTIQTSTGGTYTNVVYNARGVIKQVS